MHVIYAVSSRFGAEVLGWKMAVAVTRIVLFYTSPLAWRTTVSISRLGLLPVVIVCTNPEIRARENAVCKD